MHDDTYVDMEPRGTYLRSVGDGVWQCMECGEIILNPHDRYCKNCGEFIVGYFNYHGNKT